MEGSKAMKDLRLEHLAPRDNQMFETKVFHGF